MSVANVAACHLLSTPQAEGLPFDRDKKSTFSSCLEMLLLTVKLSWPMTLVVSKRQLLHYQVILAVGCCDLARHIWADLIFGLVDC